MFAHRNPHATNPDHLRAIHFQSRDGCASHGRQADYEGMIFPPCKVVRPSISVRMEHWAFRIGFWIDRRSMIRFETIAHWAGKAKVVQRGLAAHRARYDVFEFEGRCGQLFSGAAVCTTIPEAVANLPLEIDGNVNGHTPATSTGVWLKVYRARVLSNVS